MSLTLAQVATVFLERQGLASSTVYGYEITLGPFLERYGKYPIQTVTREMVADYLNSRDSLHYTTHQRHQDIIQALFNFALEQEYLEVNPIARLKHRKPDPFKGEHRSDEIVRYLSPEKLKVLYELVAPNYRMNALVQLLHRTGARVGEILALDFDAVDFGARKFQVIGKGNKSRWCFYSEDVATALAKYFKYDRHSEHPALFTSQHPTTKKVNRLSYPTAYKEWKQICDRAEELKDARLHDLRHTFATERVGLMGIEELRALMGHENIQFTLRYQKVTSSRAEEVAQKALATLNSSIP
ncbi:tyrosine-type recombinase/integrase [Laspinema sp. D1]|uniref:tyrosine-type recombinase/integrase n=1 Tax=Laspinema palackyanum TaxID=3231601 RepID=UPI00349B3DF4|nr:tyrosine-type recombinase/integrase [Laspinema sp. D2b]